MRTLRLKKQFKKDAKKAIRNPRQDTEKLTIITDILQKHGELPEEYLPHQLIGN